MSTGVTKDDLLLSWTKTSCVDYKKGSVMVVEDKKDTNKFKGCFSPTQLNKMKEGKVYQYIISNKDMKIIPNVKGYEIGTKHVCLVRYFDDEDLILASGELVKDGDVIVYSCMSSLFLTLLKFLWKQNKITKKEEKNNFQHNYESSVVKGYIEKYFKSEKVVYIKHIETGEREEFRIEELCKKKNPPTCLRYMKPKDCKLQMENPEGPDCDVGIDFCSNLDVEDPPEVIIPESKYVYITNLDMKKVKEYYESQGKTKLAPMWLRMYLSQDKLMNDPRFLKKELTWPILE